jgi:hypothetical protein
VRKLFIFLACLTGTAFAQAQSLKGIVRYADNRSPVVAASVFLANTSIGTVTKENGEFVISNFPDGRYDLVVSFVGYESFTLSVQSNHLPENIEVLLKPKVNELKEVILEPYLKDGWEKWGKFFMENFIGMSAAASDCELQNKGVIKFRLNKKENILTVTAGDRLEIENHFLGYHLKYDLVSFEYNMRTHLLLFQGYPFFQEMDTKRSGLKKKWLANREEAYYGSMMHFMRSLFRNKLVEQQFEVRRLIKVSNAERERVSKIHRTLLSGMMGSNVNVVVGEVYRGLNADTAAYYKKVMQNPESMNYLINRVLPGDSIAYAIDSTVAGLNFKDFLQITYKSKDAPFEYYRFTNQQYMKAPIVSEITRTSPDPVMIWANGTYYETTTIISSGYWGFSEKIAELLPIGYWPPPKKTK